MKPDKEKLKNYI